MANNFATAHLQASLRQAMKCYVQWILAWYGNEEGNLGKQSSESNICQMHISNFHWNLFGDLMLHCWNCFIILKVFALIQCTSNWTNMFSFSCFQMKQTLASFTWVHLTYHSLWSLIQLPWGLLIFFQTLWMVMNKKDSYYRVFIRHRRLEKSLASKQNSLAKFCLFPERALPLHNNPPLQYSPATPILNENPAISIVSFVLKDVYGNQM